MKAISSALKTHLAQQVTSLATCWLVTRTDGQVFSFTDHDADLVVSGVTYKASSGYTRTAMKSDQTLAVDNMEITGILQSAQITDADLKAGKFDYAAINVFLVNWSDLSQGILKMRAGTFGETIRNPTGIFHAEQRGLTQALITDVTENYTPTCRADLGDSKCKIPIKPVAWAAGTPAIVGTYVSDPAPVDDATTLAIYQCNVGGTTGTTRPSFNATLGSFITESTGVVWSSVQPFRQVATVSSVSGAKNRFTASSVSVPPTTEGAIATVTFGGIAAIGLQITLNVGTQTVMLGIPGSYNSSDAVLWLTNSVNNAHTAGTIAATANAVFTGSNNHSVVITKVNPVDSGSITVQGDLTEDIQLSDFSGAGSVGSPYFAGGLVTWVTGANAGISMEMKDFTPATGILDLYLNMPFAITVGDKFYYQPGCDKTRQTCYFSFNNILNFRGEPDVPGLDTMLRYPVS